MEAHPFPLVIGVTMVFFISVAVFVVTNLITAVIVKNAMSIAADDSEHEAKQIEAKKKADLKVLADMFLELHENGSGDLSQEEFLKALDTKRIQELLYSMDMKNNEFVDIWNTLDDGDGHLTIK